MTPLSQEWVQKAEGDYQTALWLMKASSINFDAVVFHAQQSVEKYLKALLQEKGVQIPRTHDLEELLGLIVPLDPSWNAYRADVSRLTPYGVLYRYPGQSAILSDAQDAIQRATTLRRSVRVALGLTE
jgi:HEPN domain-containing protein